MTYRSYILECFKDGGSRCYYTGQTGDLWKRVSQHIDNVRSKTTEKYTGRLDFVTLVWAEECKTRGEALDLERAVEELPYQQERSRAPGIGGLILVGV